MGDQIARPVFYEGQILGAVDLHDTVEYSRGREARHERYLHTWGIASGLELSEKSKQIEVNGNTVDYKEIWLSPGIAIDGYGREVIVPELRRLSENDFDQLNVAIQDKNALYPVLLMGQDRSASTPSFSMGDCAVAAPTREIEDFVITFRGPGEDLDLANQIPPEISAGPGNGTTRAWLILLGYVMWDDSITKFTGFKLTSAGVGRRYAGVLADEVTARGGSLTLRTRVKSESGKPALVLDETGDAELRFGRFDATGVVTPILTVKANGDIITPGIVQSKLTSGRVYVQSGIASDGVVLPLPSGVKSEDVAPGKGTLHVQVSLRINGVPPPTAAGDWAAIPLECSIDDERRVRCQVRWLELSALPNFEDRPGVCDYVLLVAIPATDGG